MVDSSLARALVLQIEVNFALMDALMQVIVEANLAETDSLKKRIEEVSRTNRELIEHTKTVVNNIGKG